MLVNLGSGVYWMSKHIVKYQLLLTILWHKFEWIGKKALERFNTYLEANLLSYPVFIALVLLIVRVKRAWPSCYPWSMDDLHVTSNRLPAQRVHIIWVTDITHDVISIHCEPQRNQNNQASDTYSIGAPYTDDIYLITLSFTGHQYNMISKYNTKWFLHFTIDKLCNIKGFFK